MIIVLVMTCCTGKPLEKVSSTVLAIAGLTDSNKAPDKTSRKKRFMLNPPRMLLVVWLKNHNPRFALMP
jgi:hypothetical protein